ncbi:hypothetical protein [Nocardia seriolae]|uniref:Uncharacterized protein n=1 Tax=Nocardia seriolae TaxID=37332 RepID=A0ABC9YVQ2_9NOCA|nr:hypothetical protein [Nocardia seriolae]APA98985.1 hypothetical protein NS506_04939 [Nocardia seriolae]MTJ64035.1 hypothetical protein [Nocardia seriolae]MTJ71297.1 hypothetical protein [Nocardia seriolae]MTJ88596.1 hypothetical protein [Nocardia seriolae]MTK32580.1 hypothetical protein [Nocardia seriolae]
MVSIRLPRRATGVAAIFTVVSAAGLLTAAPASAANTITVDSAGPAAVGIDYTCESGAGVAGIDAMVGDPNAEGPAATGSQTAVTCDGSQHTATIALTAVAGQPPLASGAPVQVRVALVDKSETVVAGTAKLLTLS